MAKVRKIGYTPRRNVYRQLQFVPKLLLSGNWMKEAGFVIGSSVRVMVQDGKITIENE